jgi:hypothetical protein
MEDGRAFNIRDAAGHLLCPACGFPNYAYDEAYDERGGLIGITICPCCLWEPGFDDDAPASGEAKPTILGSLRAYRLKWRDGPVWRGRDKPPGWSGSAQLTRLF